MGSDNLTLPGWLGCNSWRDLPKTYYIRTLIVCIFRRDIRSLTAIFWASWGGKLPPKQPKAIQNTCQKVTALSWAKHSHTNTGHYNLQPYSLTNQAAASSGLFGESFPRHRNHRNHRSRAAFGAFHPSWIVHARDSSWKVKPHGDVVKLENLEKILKAQNCSKLSCSDQLPRNIWWHDTPWYVYCTCIPAGLRRKCNLADLRKGDPCHVRSQEHVHTHVPYMFIKLCTAV